jgi:hypothetical protein
MVATGEAMMSEVKLCKLYIHKRSLYKFWCNVMQVCWALGYTVATLFFAVVEMSIDAIVLSFCQDSEEHQGTAQYAPPLLIETLDNQNEMHRLTQGSQ